jgi:hypothetical protein
MESDRHILNSNNVMRMSWKLVNKELGKDWKNYEFQSLNINGRSITNHQVLPMPLIITSQLFLPLLVEKLKQITVILKPLIILRITLSLP